MTDLPAAIGRYRIERRLGGGAMGVVYKAHDPSIERTVAIKLIRTDLLESGERPAYLARFRREAQAAGRCIHSNIVAIYDFAMHDGNPFLTMEYVPGVSLSQSLASGTRYDVRGAVSVIMQVLAALACAHGQGIVHRDIKPANILLLPNGQVKVTDFGISRVDTSNLTESGSLVGTPSYMSPEQCRGDQVDLRADLFSTAAVLFEMLCGERLFNGATQAEVLFALLQKDTPHLHERMQAAPAALDRVLQKALAKRPDQRYSSAAEMVQALRAAMLETTGSDDLIFSDATALLDAPRQTPSAVAASVARTEPAIDATLISVIERHLAHYAGPIARLLVQSAIRKTHKLEEVCVSLASGIENASDRERFLRDTRSALAKRDRSASGIRSGSQSLPPTQSASIFSSNELDEAQRELARYLGPIAKVVVRREAATARTLPELWDALSSHIERDAERATFLRKRPIR